MKGMEVLKGCGRAGMAGRVGKVCLEKLPKRFKSNLVSLF